MPTEGAKLSGASQEAKTVCGHNSGESLKWAPKVHGWQHPYLSGQRTEKCLRYGILFTVASLTFYRSIFCTPVFYLLDIILIIREREVC